MIVYRLALAPAHDLASDLMTGVPREEGAYYQDKN